MARAVLLVSAVFSDETSVAARSHGELAKALARAGIAVHVICSASNREAAIRRAGGVTEYCIIPFAPSDTSPFAEARDWSATVESSFRQLQPLVHFDAIIAPATEAEALRAVAPRIPLLLLDQQAGSLQAAEILCSLHSVTSPVELPASVREPLRCEPRLGVVVLAEEDSAALRRTVLSLAAHTEVPSRVVVLYPSGSDPHDEAFLDDALVTVVQPPERCTAGRALNLALAAVGVPVDAYALIEAGSELLEGWWCQPFARLSADHTLILAGDGAPEEPSLRLFRGDLLETVGRFDEHPERDAMAFFNARTARLGFRQSCASDGLVLQHDPRRGARVRFGAAPALPDGATFVAVADASEALESPELLVAWAEAFTVDDPAVLALYGPGGDPTSYVQALTEVARGIGYDLENGPKLVVKMPAIADPDFETVLEDEALALLSARPQTSRFPSLARFGASDGAALRNLAARLWLTKSRAAA